MKLSETKIFAKMFKMTTILQLTIRSWIAFTDELIVSEGMSSVFQRFLTDSHKTYFSGNFEQFLRLVSLFIKIKEINIPIVSFYCKL